MIENEVIELRVALKIESNLKPNVNLNLVYSSSNEEKHFIVGSENEDFKFKLFQELKNDYNWTIRDYIVQVKNNSVCLKSLNIINEEQDLSCKVGYLSIHNSFSEVLPIMANKVKNLSFKNKSCIRLDNKHFYSVEINWNLDDDNDKNFKCFNLFMKQNDELPYKYIGTTTAQYFNLCLELVNFYFNYSKNSDYNTPENKICKISVQYVNENHVSNEFNQEFHSIVDIEIPGGASISRIVTDFEDVF